MRHGPFAFLIFLTAAAVAAAVAAPRPERGLRAPERSGELVYPGLAGVLADVNEIQLKTPETALTFTRSSGVWRTAERGGYPADARKLAETAFALSELKYVEPKTGRPGRYPRLQIEDPDIKGAASRRIRLTGPNGALLADLTAGRRKLDMSAAGAKRGLYIRKTGDVRGWLAAGFLNITDDAASWLQSEIIHIAPDRVKNVVLVHSGGEQTALSRKDSGGAYAISSLPKGAAAKAPGLRAEIAGALENLALRDVAPAKDMTFTGGARVEAAFETFDGLNIELTLRAEPPEDGDGEGDGDARWWASVAAHAGRGADAGVKDEAAALTARTKGWLYLLPAWKSERLTRRNADLAKLPPAAKSEPEQKLPGLKIE